MRRLEIFLAVEAFRPGATPEKESEHSVTVCGEPLR